MRQTRAPGTYVLVVWVEQDISLRIGSLGILPFKAGHYLYVGSALNGLDARLARHQRCEKRTHWHIDYLLPHGEIREIWYRRGRERCECLWAQALAAMPGVEPFPAPFGASDCSCPTHLFCSQTPPPIRSFQAEPPCSDARLWSIPTSIHMKSQVLRAIYLNPLQTG